MTPSKPARWLARVFATWFGCGYSRWAPGTAGALGALPLHFALCTASAPLHAAGVVVICVLGLWAAQRHAEATGQDDPQSVVIDEVAGALIALGMVRFEGVLPGFAAWGAFRALDVWKPGPIRRLEHTRPLGAGIMLDDILAGLVAGGLVWAATRAAEAVL